MITKAFAPMPVRNVEMFRRVRAQLQLGAANPQKPVAADPRTASSESKRSAAEPHELCIYMYRDLQPGAKLASLSSWSWSSPQFLVKTAHQDTTEQISKPPELCEQECNRKRRRSYDRCSTSFLQLQRNATTLSQAQIASELKFPAAA
jgi:hypothetical protein